MNEYPRLVIIRRPRTEGQPTRGSFLWFVAPAVSRLLMIRCLELEWLDNAKGKSCIPAGVYPMRWSMSNRFKRMMWEVCDVPGRAGIRIHSGNYAGDKISSSEGCILPCQQWADINGDGVIDGASSKQALSELEAHLKPYQDTGLMLEIKWA